MRGLPIEQVPATITPPQVQRHRDLRRRRRRHRRAVGGDADRAADERRRPHDLHAVDQRQRRHHDADASRSRSAPTPTPRNVLAQNRVAQAQARLPPSVSAYGLTVREALRLAAARLRALLAARQLRQPLPRQLRHHQPHRRALARARRRRRRASSARSDYSMRIWVNPEVLANLGLTVADLAARGAAAEHGQPRRPGRRRAGAAAARCSRTPSAPRGA